MSGNCCFKVGLFANCLQIEKLTIKQPINQVNKCTVLFADNMLKKQKRLTCFIKSISLHRVENQ
jgi:hypothetical protein